MSDQSDSDELIQFSPEDEEILKTNEYSDNDELVHFSSEDDKEVPKSSEEGDEEVEEGGDSSEEDTGSEAESVDADQPAITVLPRKSARPSSKKDPKTLLESFRIPESDSGFKSDKTNAFKRRKTITTKLEELSENYNYSVHSVLLAPNGTYFVTTDGHVSEHLTNFKVIDPITDNSMHYLDYLKLTAQRVKDANPVAKQKLTKPR